VSNHIEAIKSNEAHLIITSGHAAESLSGFVKETTPRVLGLSISHNFVVIIYLEQSLWSTKIL